MKKKITIIANSGFTVINFRSDLIKSLVQQNISVSVICPQKCSLMGNRDIKKELEEIGGVHYDVPLNRTGINPVKDFYTIFQLYRKLSEIRPDIVVSYTAKANVYGGLISRLFNETKMVVNITGIGSILSNKDIKSKMIALMLKVLYRAAIAKKTTVIFQNNCDKKLFKKLNIIHGEQARVVPGSGVNIVRFKRSKFHFEGVSFIFVGRLLKDKGVTEYLEAAKCLKQRHENVAFGLLGQTDDHYKSISEKLLKKYVSDGVIKWEPPSNRVWEVLNNYQIFVLPSYREGLTKSGLEALSMSMPVILTDVPGCRELVNQNVNGYLVEAGNCESLKLAMEKFITDKEKIPIMGSESRGIAKRNYSSVIITKALEEIIL